MFPLFLLFFSIYTVDFPALILCISTILKNIRYNFTLYPRILQSLNMILNILNILNIINIINIIKCILTRYMQHTYKNNSSQSIICNNCNKIINCCYKWTRSYSRVYLYLMEEHWCKHANKA